MLTAMIDTNSFILTFCHHLTSSTSRDMTGGPGLRNVITSGLENAWEKVCGSVVVYFCGLDEVTQNIVEECWVVV